MPLPTGPAVTFLFTDIEGSTRLEQQVGSYDWATIVARHDQLLRGAIESNGGVVVKTEGDAFFAAFDRPEAAARAAVAAQRALAAEAWPEPCELKVRMGDSMTFHAGVFLKSGDPATSWEYVRDGLRWFAENDNQSGIARALGMAAIVLLLHGDVELGARAIGATYRIVEDKGVMLAPVKVLHMPDPRHLAIERLGAEKAEELLRDGAAAPVDEIIREVLAAPAPGEVSTPTGAAEH
jgi:hypothetical protein